MKKILIAAMMSVVAAAAIPGGVAFAKHGVDDPAGHVRGEGAGHR